MSTKPTAASVNDELQLLKAAFEAQAEFINSLCGKITDMRSQIEALEAKNVQLHAQLLEDRATKNVAKPAAKPEAKYTDGVLTFLPQGVMDIVAVSPDDHPYRALKDSTGAQHRCDGRVWAYWKTMLERRQKAAAREQA